MLIISDYPPTPQGRPRVTRFVTYDPMAPQKKQFLKSILNQLPSEPLKTPLVVKINFYFKRPKSHYNSKGKLKRFAPLRHTSRPDIDNLLKFVLDALNKHLYVDDSQIISLIGRKLYAEKEGIEIYVRNFNNLSFEEKDFVFFANNKK